MVKFRRKSSLLTFLKMNCAIYSVNGLLLFLFLFSMWNVHHRLFLRDLYLSRPCFYGNWIFSPHSASGLCRSAFEFTRNRFLKLWNGRQIDRYSLVDYRKSACRFFYKLSLYAIHCSYRSIVEEFRLRFSSSFLRVYFKKISQVKPTHSDLDMRTAIYSKHR